MSKCIPIHECPKQKCTCAFVDELTRLYRDLKCLRKKGKKIKSTSDNAREFEFCLTKSEIELYEKNPSARNSIMRVIRAQRENARSFMITLREENDKLVQEEEEIYRIDREIADLQNQISLIKKKFEEKSSSDAMQGKDKQIEDDDKIWKETIKLEIQEYNRLQKKIKETKKCLENQKMKAKLVDKQMEQEKQIDLKLLLDAVNFIEKCTNDCKTLSYE